MVSSKKDIIKHLIIFLFISGYSIHAQWIKNDYDKIPPSQKMILEVKVISQFYERFNFKPSPDNQLLDSVFKKHITRRNNLCMLFNTNDLRLDSTSTHFSKTYYDKAKSFIEMVCDTSKPLYINKFSNYLLSELVCKVTIKSKPCEIKLWMQLIEAENKSYKWIMLNAQGKELEIKRSDNKKIAISPMDDETNFISLGTELNKKSNLANFAKPSFESETLNNFLFGLQNGMIIFQSVKDLTYHILDIDGWDIQVKNIQNDYLFNGWLIFNLNNYITDKKQYINDLIHLKN